MEKVWGFNFSRRSFFSIQSLDKINSHARVCVQCFGFPNHRDAAISEPTFTQVSIPAPHHLWWKAMCPVWLWPMSCISQCQGPLSLGHHGTDLHEQPSSVSSSSLLAPREICLFCACPWIWTFQKIFYPIIQSGLLLWQRGKNSPAMQETWVQSLVGKIPWRRERLPPPFWPREFHGLYSPWGHKELDTS